MYVVLIKKFAYLLKAKITFKEGGIHWQGGHKLVTTIRLLVCTTDEGHLKK